MSLNKKRECSNDEPNFDSSDDEADIKKKRRTEEEIEQQQEQKHQDPTEQNGPEDAVFNHEAWAFDNESTGSIDVTEEMFAFCCSNCTCSEVKVARFWNTKQNCGNSGNSQLWHRGCCHNINNANSDYLTPSKKAIEAGIKMLGMDEIVPKAKPISHLLKKYRTAKMEETKHQNNLFDTAKDLEIYTNEVYATHVKESNDRRKEKPKLKSLRVLDLFCGIGSGTLVLKKMGIPLKTVVHVEHDPVAMYVNKFHNDKANDGIEHIYKVKYEEIRRDVEIEDLIKLHGPFDLLLAAAPCKNYSQVNGYRVENRKTEKIDYLSDVGRLIAKIDEIQKQNSSDQSSLLFLSENVNFERKLVDEVSESYGGLEPVRLDAKDFGPCKRDRLYWSNITLSNATEITDTACEQSACSLLDGGYVMAETVCKDDNGEIIIPKANTFMASKVRIDDDRMIKVKRKGDGYYIDKYSVSERERMLGLPIGYVSKAVKNLFKELTEKAFLRPEAEEGSNWRTLLSEELHNFRMCCEFKMKPQRKEPYFHIELSTPKEGKTTSLYNEDAYCKHLLGNGWSIPVVEYILGGLKDLCDEASFEGYDYNYPWPPYNSLGKVQEAETADV